MMVKKVKWVMLKQEYGNKEKHRQRFNLKKVFSKRVLIGFLTLVALAGIGGFFYYWFFYETPPEKWSKAPYSPAEEYKVVETEEGKRVVNKKAGISFDVPEEWSVNKPRQADYVALLSPEAEDKLFIEKGCKIITETRYIKTSLKTIERVLRDSHASWNGSDEYEKTEMSGYEGLRNVFSVKNAKQYLISLHIPVRSIKGKVFTLGLSSHKNNREECSEYFSEFLKTVTIY